MKNIISVTAQTMFFGLLLVFGCSDDLDKKPGSEGGECNAGSKCNNGLTCASGLCVRLPDSGTIKKDGAIKDMAIDSNVPDQSSKVDSTIVDKMLKDHSKPDSYAPPGNWVMVAAGKFKMGSPSTELCREKGTAKETQHEVTLTNGFEISTTEVTQGQFKSVMGYNPSHFTSCGTNCPVEQVSWYHAVSYCNKLSDLAKLSTCYINDGSKKACVSNNQCAKDELCIEKKCTRYSTSAKYSGAKIYMCPGYRLPTEAEWEYAYRAGTTYAYYNGPITDCSKDPRASVIGWYAYNSSKKTQIVGQKIANKLGLYDMPGNVHEWCHDWYLPDLGSAAVTDPWGNSVVKGHLLRGGGHGGLPNSMRAAARGAWAATSFGNHIGFRCARTK